jgi:hypothetical protein
MISSKGLAANRRNARKSRGPRTPEGKAAARRNALRHGITTITCRNPAFASEIEEMARALCEGDTSPCLFQHALVVAECDLVLRFLCRERVAVIERCRDNPEHLMEEGADERREYEPLEPPTQERDEVDAFCEAIPDLEKLERYERRAWSRQKRATRDFIGMKSWEDNP